MRIHLIWGLVIILLNFIHFPYTSGSNAFDDDVIEYTFIDQIELPNTQTKCDQQMQLCFIFSSSTINVYNLQQLQIIQTIQIEENNIFNLHLAVSKETLILIVQVDVDNVLIYSLDKNNQRQITFTQQSYNTSSNQYYNQQVYIRNQPSKDLKLSMNLRRQQEGRKQQNHNQQNHLMYFISQENNNKNILFCVYVFETKFQANENKPMKNNKKEINTKENNNMKNIFSFKQKINLQIQENKSQIINAIISTNQQLLAFVDDQLNVGFYSLTQNNIQEINMLTINYLEIFQVNKPDSSYYLDNILISYEQFFIVTLSYKSSKQNIIILDILTYCLQQQKIIYFQRQLLQNKIKKLLITKFQSKFNLHSINDTIQEMNGLKGDASTPDSQLKQQKISSMNKISTIQNIIFSKYNQTEIGVILFLDENGIQQFIKQCSNNQQYFFTVSNYCGQKEKCLNNRTINNQQICDQEKKNIDLNEFNQLENNKSNKLKFVSKITVRQQNSLCVYEFKDQNKLNLVIIGTLLILIGYCIQKNLDIYTEKYQLGKDKQQKNNKKLQENNNYNFDKYINTHSNQTQEQIQQTNSNKQFMIKQNQDQEVIKYNNTIKQFDVLKQQQLQEYNIDYFDKFCHSQNITSNLNSIQLQVFVFENSSSNHQVLQSDYSNNILNKNNTIKINKYFKKKNKHMLNCISSQNIDNINPENSNVLNNLMNLHFSDSEDQEIHHGQRSFQKDTNQNNKIQEFIMQKQACKINQNYNLLEEQNELIYQKSQSLDNFEQHSNFNLKCIQQNLQNSNIKLSKNKKIQKQPNQVLKEGYQIFKDNQNQKIIVNQQENSIIHNEIKINPIKVQFYNREIEKQDEQNSDQNQNKFKYQSYPILQKQKMYQQMNQYVEDDYIKQNKYSNKYQQKQKQYNQDKLFLEEQIDNTCTLETTQPFYIIEQQEEGKVLTKDLNFNLQNIKFIPKFRSRKEHTSLLKCTKKYPNLEQNIINNNQANPFSKNNFQLQSCEDYFQFPFSKSIKLHFDSWPQYNQNLNCFSQQSYICQNNNVMKNKSKFQNYYNQIKSSTQNQFQKKYLLQRPCFQQSKLNQTYNQLNLQKNNQIKKSDFLLKNNLSEQSSQINNQINYLSNQQQITSIINCDNSIFSALNQDTSNQNNAYHTQQQLSQSNSTLSKNNQFSEINNSDSSPQMWPLTYQEQQNNFEEDILNQMDMSGTSTSQTNTSLLNSDFQCQRFMDNFLEQMGQNEKQEENEYEPFFCFSETTEKQSFFSSLTNEFSDSVRKIRHINQELKQQDSFDIKNFQLINESLFEESIEQKKNPNRYAQSCYNIYNPIQKSVEFTSIFGEENSQIQNLQKMTEQINNDFLLSCANLLNAANNNSQQ